MFYLWEFISIWGGVNASSFRFVVVTRIFHEICERTIQCTILGISFLYASTYIYSERTKVFDHSIYLIIAFTLKWYYMTSYASQEVTSFLIYSCVYTRIVIWRNLIFCHIFSHYQDMSSLSLEPIKSMKLCKIFEILDQTSVVHYFWTFHCIYNGRCHELSHLWTIGKLSQTMHFYMLYWSIKVDQLSTLVDQLQTYYLSWSIANLSWSIANLSWSIANIP